jgi:hypothetical protein
MIHGTKPPVIIHGLEPVVMSHGTKPPVMIHGPEPVVMIHGTKPPVMIHGPEPAVKIQGTLPPAFFPPVFVGNYLFSVSVCVRHGLHHVRFLFTCFFVKVSLH